MRRPIVWAKWVSSALVGAFTEQNRSEPLEIHLIEKHHMEVDISCEARRYVNQLDQRDGTGLGRA